MSIPNDIILYHYPFSPYAQRVTNYLALRGIDYAQCLQPPMLPRPDLHSLGINYRRIPLLTIARDIYADTRLIISELENRFPTHRLSASTPAQRGIEHLLNRYITDAGIFNRAAQLLPPDLPLMQDKRFQADRKQMTGREWSPEVQRKGRAEALVHIRDLFEVMEHGFLGDGREWVLGTEGPMLADVEGSWVFTWLFSMEGALPMSEFGEKVYPRVHAWVGRFNGEVKRRSKKPVTVKGDVAREFILGAKVKGQGVDGRDPTGLKKGHVVTVYPLDSGSKNKDTGKLVTLTSEEVAIEVENSEGKKVVLHTPRWNFRIEPNHQSPKL